MNLVNTSLVGAIAAHIDSHQTEGIDWPSTATHCVVVRYKTWPCDWGGKNIQFFDSRLDLNRWLERTKKWATYEDNCVEYRVYEWDWGPNLTAQNSLAG